jgi:hypothetical protein
MNINGNYVDTHCVLHCKSLAVKELCPELSEAVDAVITVVNYMKT